VDDTGKIVIEVGHTSDIPTRTVETLDEAEADRVLTHPEDNRDGDARCRSLGRHRGRGTRCENHNCLSARDQIGKQAGQQMTDLTSSVQAALSDNFIGVYLQGSFALAMRTKTAMLISSSPLFAR
jgi:hypothetical protein